MVWLVDNPEKERDNFPKEIKLVEYTKKNAIKEFASAKVWISNQRMPSLYEKGLYKKEGQFYIQTWHGMALKKIEKDIENEKQWWCKFAKIDSKYIDLLTANCKTHKEILKNCFYYDGEITDFGPPRDDIFMFSDDRKQDIINKIHKDYNIPKDNRIVLYAPTFRDNGNI